MRLFIFGFGYTGKALARRAVAKGWAVAATVRKPDDGVAAQALGVQPLSLEEAGYAALGVDAVLVTAPPGPDGCPGLATLRPALEGARPAWIGYLSTTGVYGDRDGRWVNEDSALAAQSMEGARRAAAEHDWLQAGRDLGQTVTVFRLPGIYGPGRSPFERLRAGTAQRLVKPGHVFSRIHVDDLAAGLEASIARPRTDGIYNLCDDEPASAADVTAYAARLLGVEPPPEQAFDPDTLSPAARRFYAECKRVSNARAKAELGWRPAYPTYREGLEAILRSSSV